MCRSSRKPAACPRAAFTFVEMLAAMIFMAIVLPVAVEGIVLANSVSTRALHKRQAMRLADRILNQVMIDEAWEDGEQSGDFGEDFPQYRWEIAVDSWEIDSMLRVTATVSYTVQDREYSESIGTLVADTTDDEAEEEETDL
jgi:general secretion pathway protein I